MNKPLGCSDYSNPLLRETKLAEDGLIHTDLNSDHGMGKPEESCQVQAKHVLYCFSFSHSTSILSSVTYVPVPSTVLGAQDRAANKISTIKVRSKQATKCIFVNIPMCLCVICLISLDPSVCICLYLYVSIYAT